MKDNATRYAAYLMKKYGLKTDLEVWFIDGPVTNEELEHLTKCQTDAYNS